jgi:hypothetical protein
MQVIGNGVTLVREKRREVGGEKETRRKFSILVGAVEFVPITCLICAG